MSLPEGRHSSHEARLNRRQALRALLGFAVFAPLLGACSDGSGFQPLYATNSVTGANAEQRLAQVDIQTIPSRVGQRVRNELIFHSTGGGNPAPPAYRLEVAIRESLASTLVNRTGDAASQVYALDASFRLIRLADKKAILEGTSSGRAGFERFTTIFSNVRAREDAENRAARVVAQDMKVRLAAFLATQA
jgi:LPS-assembly lipoprotein